MTNKTIWIVVVLGMLLVGLAVGFWAGTVSRAADESNIIKAMEIQGERNRQAAQSQADQDRRHREHLADQEDWRRKHQ